MSHIACFDTFQMNQTAYETLYLLASPERKKRADRYLCYADSLRCIVADALLRYAVTQATDSLPRLTIVHNSYGKPQMEALESFHYNLSHSGRWVVIAYGNHEVGIDVEEIRMDAQKESLLLHYLHPEEQAYIVQAPQEHRSERFFQIWTAKESYLKYLGIGLRKALNSFSVLSITEPFLYSRILEGNYSMTLCSSETVHTIEFLRVEELLPS